jgi:hypothetical protein
MKNNVISILSKRGARVGAQQAPTAQVAGASRDRGGIRLATISEHEIVSRFKAGAPVEAIACYVDGSSPRRKVQSVLRDYINTRVPQTRAA